MFHSINNKILILLIIIFFSSCSNIIPDNLNGTWGVYEIDYNGIDLINHNRKFKSIVDQNLYIDSTYKKFLLTLFDNEIKGDYDFYKKTNKYYFKTNDVNDKRYNGDFLSSLDTIHFDIQSDIIRLTLKSDSMIIRARKVILKNKKYYRK